MKFRDYQVEARDAIFGYFTVSQGNPLVALPTGTGKSVVIAAFLQAVYRYYPGQRVVMLTHVKELIEQNLDKLLRVWPLAPAGVFSAGLKRKDIGRKITFAGIATAAKCPDVFGHIDLVIIDECQLVSDNDNSQYRAFIAALKAVNPALKVIGLSATIFRLGMGLLTDGSLFTDVCYDRTSLEGFNWFIDQGYLSPLVPKRTKVELDVSSVGTSGGEFKQNQLAEVVDDDATTRAAVREMIEYGHDRQRWLVFATGIKHTEHVVAMFKAHGISAVAVHSKLKEEARAEALAGHRSGKYRVIVNNNVLTTGYDDPLIDLIGVLRPTKSPVLWVQMLGRGTRPVYAHGFNVDEQEGRLAAIAAGPKQNCLVLDFAGNTRRLGPINDPRIPNPKKKGGGEAPFRVCEACDTYNHARAEFCFNCGAPFEKRETITRTASTAELIARTPEPLGPAYEPEVVPYTVSSVSYRVHQKYGKPDSIRVDYTCGMMFYREWVCIEHTGPARAKARAWLRAALRPELFASADDREAFIDEATVEQIMTAPSTFLREPRTIEVWVNTKHPEVLRRGYE